jgi:tetratricopeptide (TPR) repeat protein
MDPDNLDRFMSSLLTRLFEKQFGAPLKQWSMVNSQQCPTAPTARLCKMLLLRQVACALIWHGTSSFVYSQAISPASESERARQLMVAGRSDEAIQIYTRLVHAFPGNPDLLLNLSIAEFNSKRFRDAAQHAAAALELKPDLAPADLFLGASELQLGDYVKAVDPLQKAVGVMTADRNSRLMLAEALLGSKRYDEALEQFRTSSVLLPDNPRVWYGLGQTYDALAERASRELRTRWPDSSYALVLSGDLYLKQRRFGSAFAAYREALSKEPKVQGIHRRIEQIYRQTGHPDWASREPSSEGDRARLAEAGTGPAWYYVSYTSNRELANRAYDRLGQLPPSLEQHLHQAAALDAEGQYQKAAVEWREALKLAPKNLDASIGLARALVRGQEYEAALPILADVVKQRPDSVEANFLSGTSLLNLQRPEAALPYLQTALKLDPQLEAAAAALGQALLQDGKPDEAVPFIKNSLSADEDGNGHFQLFRAYQLTGDHQSAKQAFDAYTRFRAIVEERRRLDDGYLLAPPSN